MDECCYLPQVKPETNSSTPFHLFFFLFLFPKTTSFGLVNISPNPTAKPLSFYLAMVEEFMPVPQLCRLILVVMKMIFGLNLAKEGDYAVLLDNKLGQTKFDGGYVHNGLLKVARWVFHAEWVVALLVLIVVHNLDKLGSIERNKIRCFAIVDLEWL
ncbi:hypothetical protein KPL71_008001 [Citrus sinensis]|uniref:Uncharacterized protein n=1 Tax=Citrus sinensis TaxID=2711 RepID=A0ACB8M3S2_CITSI|nr:hypothetical protein KPL71_008001 [Citrus sinensis]